MRIISLEEPQQPIKWYQISQWPFFAMPFRPLFLLPSIWSALAIIIWIMTLTGLFNWTDALPATLWHAHEMIFGFAGAIAVGFLLTAAQTWTNVPSISGWPLIALVSIWCAVRGIFLVQPNWLPIVMLGQLAFWLSAIVFLSHMLLTVRSTHNYQFIAILCLLCVLNMFFLAFSLYGEFFLARILSHLAILGFMLLIGLIGGRVIPFFTAKGLKLNHQVKTPKLDLLLLLVSILGMCGFALNQIFLVPLNPGYLIVFAAILHLVRSCLWFNLKIYAIPLLWSLQLGYLLAATGLLMTGLSFFHSEIIFSNALHLITLGGLGLTILAMLARVSLGHTGRTLAVNKMMSLAFALIATSAVIRAFLPSILSPDIAWLSSAILWSIAFALFSYLYFPVLTQKRVDGRRG